MIMAAAIACASPWVIDGDSIRCRNIGEVRLLGIDAPDFVDSPPCRGHYGDHVCDDEGDRRATKSLIAARRLRPWTVEPITHDRYGRTVAIVRAGGVNLSCWQLQRGAARYIARYDTGGLIARECR